MRAMMFDLQEEFQKLKNHEEVMTGRDLFLSIGCKQALRYAVFDMAPGQQATQFDNIIHHSVSSVCRRCCMPPGLAGTVLCAVLPPAGSHWDTLKQLHNLHGYPLSHLSKKARGDISHLSPYF